MKKAVLVFALSALVAPLASAQLIISEIVDGTFSSGQPTFVEITNLGTTDFTFTSGGIAVLSNNNPDEAIDADLSGVTISAGQSFVIAGNQTAFTNVYGFEA